MLVKCLKSIVNGTRSGYDVLLLAHDAVLIEKLLQQLLRTRVLVFTSVLSNVVANVFAQRQQDVNRVSVKDLVYSFKQFSVQVRHLFEVALV